MTAFLLDPKSYPKYSAKISQNFPKLPRRLLREKSALLKRHNRNLDIQDLKIKKLQRGVSLHYKVHDHELRVYAGIIVRRRCEKIFLISLESPALHEIEIDNRRPEWKNYEKEIKRAYLKRLRNQFSRNYRLKRFIEKMDERMTEWKDRNRRPSASYVGEVVSNYIASFTLTEDEAKKARKYRDALLKVANETIGNYHGT